MTKADELLALAIRCEQATGPDRELDLRIAKRREQKPIPESANRIDGEMVWSGPLGFFLPAYTASLDAAMALVPEGCPWALCSPDGDEPAFATLAMTMAGDAEHGSGATPALALCAAALRARAASQ
jgi:hypothetical protein